MTVGFDLQYKTFFHTRNKSIHFYLELYYHDVDLIIDLLDQDYNKIYL